MCVLIWKKIYEKIVNQLEKKFKLKIVFKQEKKGKIKMLK